jgi:hypothetical protein
MCLVCISVYGSLAELFEKAMEGERERVRERVIP